MYKNPRFLTPNPEDNKVYEQVLIANPKLCKLAEIFKARVLCCDYTFEKVSRHNYSIVTLNTVICSRFTLPIAYYIINNGNKKGGENDINTEEAFRCFMLLKDTTKIANRNNKTPIKIDWT